MHRDAATTSPRPDPAEVLSKAFLRAADTLGVVSVAERAAILGVSAATASRLASRKKRLDPADNEGQRALLFLRIFRSLDALVGGDEKAARTWFAADNHHLAAPPRELVTSITGLVHVADYLDAMRGKV